MRARYLAILASMLPSPALAGVVINEFLPNPAGVDAGKEWLEIVNTGPTAVDITGWEIEAGTSSYSSRHVFAALVLNPRDRVVVGEPLVAGADIVAAVLDLHNASASGDAVRLVDSFGAPMDTVVYGPNNTDAFLDDDGNVAVSIAATPGDDDSLSRIPDGADTDASGVDFDVVAIPTLGVTNDVGGPIDTGDTFPADTTDTGAPPPACDLTGIVINELLPDPAGADADKEWVELLNTLASDVDVGGWVIESGPSSYSTSGVIPLGTFVPANGRLVVGQSALVPEGDVAAPGFVFGNASTSSDAVRILNCDGGIVDTVVYGTPNTDLWEDDGSLVAASLAPAPAESASIARVPDGADTDQSGDDFVELATPTPGTLNEAAAPVCSTDIVLINEIVSDPAGADAGGEWVELHNPGAVDVDVSGWEIEAGPSSYSTDDVLPPGSVIPAGGWLVVGQSALPEIDVVAPGFSLGNASTSADGVRLLDPGACVADTVIYGTPNTDLWLDDDGIVAASLAPQPAEDESIGRFPDGTDTDQSGADFADFATPTPGAENATGGGPIGGACDDAALGADIVINEIVADPTGTDTGFEWVELHNAGSTSVDVSGWAIASGTTSFSGSGTLPAGTLLAPGAFLVVGQTAIPEADVVAPGFSLGNATSSADGVRVEDCNGTAVDTVIYGAPNTDLWVDDTGIEATSLAPTASSPASLARVTDGVDTDASAVDFEVAAIPTPGMSNDVAPPDCGGAASELKINEFIYDPDGTDGGFEWVELFNAGNAEIDLSGWAIQKATSSFDDAFVFPDGATLAPGALLLVGESLVPGIAFEAELSLGNASSSADGVRVVDCAGFPVDTVVYGETNTDGLEDDTGVAATSLAPKSGGGASLQRVSDGYDTDASAVDFAVQAAPSPGQPNEVVEPTICVPSAGDVVLNELIPNPSGSDTGAEWIELYNRGSSPVDVSGWGIDVATSSWGDPDVVLPGGTVIDAGGWLVVGGSLAAEVDIVGDISIGNATSSADGVQLVDCTGAVVDTVVYGTANPDGLLDDAGSVVPSPVPAEAGSLARDTDGVDSDSPDDWVVRGIPSPGASNFFEVPDIDGGEDESKGCGCGGEGPPGSTLTDVNGCSTSTVPVRGMALAFLALFIRRRR